MHLKLTGKIVFVLLLVLLSGSMFSCARKPLAPVSAANAPRFYDDLDRASLKKAIKSNLEYLARQPPSKKITIADRSFPVSRLQQSQIFFLTLLDAKVSDSQLDNLITQNFDLYQATGTKGFNPRRKMLVTGYYQPVFKGSLTREGEFQYPLYSVPTDLVQRKNGQGKKIFGRMANGTLTPYWSRREIEKLGKTAGQELVWLKDPFDAFVLHVQGSGLIQLPDSSIQAVHYAAKNGRPYSSIGKHLVTTRRMKLEETNLDSIRAYISGHPDELEEILHHNESFIFFNWADSRGAIGNLGRELTAGRSIAVDQSCFPPGALGFLTTRKPTVTEKEDVQWSPLSRFVLVQDTGSAIRGPGRVDLFWGTGDTAGSEAGMMKEAGSLYFLILKEDTPRNNQ